MVDSCDVTESLKSKSFCMSDSQGVISGDYLSNLEMLLCY